MSNNYYFSQNLNKLEFLGNFYFKDLSFCGEIVMSLCCEYIKTFLYVTTWYTITTFISKCSNISKYVNKIAKLSQNIPYYFKTEV